MFVLTYKVEAYDTQMSGRLTVVGFIHSMNNLYVRETCQSPEVCPAPSITQSFADVAAGVDKNHGEGDLHGYVYLRLES